MDWDLHVTFELIEVCALVLDFLLEGLEPVHGQNDEPAILPAVPFTVTYFLISCSRMYMDSWAASRLVNESLLAQRCQR